MIYILTIYLGLAPYPLDPQMREYPTLRECVTAGAIITDDLSNPAETSYSCNLEESL